MKKISLLVLISMCLFTSAFARKVKFSVDTANHEMQREKMYILLNSDGTNAQYYEMAIEKGSIWSVVIDLPANKTYKYIFSESVDGYGNEVIPDESAAICWGCGDQDWDNDTIANVGSRWVFVDSIAKPSITSVAPKTGTQGTKYSYSVNAKLEASTATPLLTFKEWPFLTVDSEL